MTLTSRHVGAQITAASPNRDWGLEVCNYFGVNPNDVYSVVQWVDPVSRQGIVQFWGHDLNTQLTDPPMRRPYWGHEGVDDLLTRTTVTGHILVATHTYDPVMDLLS